MKKSKKLLITAAAVLLVCGVAVFAACGNNGGGKDISESAARQIAYNTLGATAADVKNVVVDKDNVAGATVYEVEFYVNGVKYDIKINAEGKVVDIEINDQTVTTSTLPASPLSDKSGYIGTDRALELALADAGFAASAVNVTENKLDFDDGKYVYEIEFVLTADGTEYDYEINATTGAIHKKDVDYVTVKVPTPAEGAYVTLDAAKAKAFEIAGITAENANLTKAVFEVDDGLHVYDIEFSTVKNGETYYYEFEINAKTGEVYYETENDFTIVEPNPGKADYVGLDAAKVTALAKYNVAAADASFTKAVFDLDDGLPVYEIEFTAGGNEYEFEINAETGAIIECDFESVESDDDDD